VSERWTMSARRVQAARMRRRMRSLWADPVWRQRAVQRHRTLNAARRLPFDAIFERHLAWEPTTGCAIWWGSRIAGFGRVNVGGRIEYVHRIAYRRATGAPIPRGWFVKHTCGVNACCAPAHLRAVAPGDPMHTGARTVEEVLALLTEPESNSNCLIWVGSRGRGGYGQITTRDYKGSAHRYVFLELGGDLLPGEHLHHECRVRSCVAPWHLVPMAVSQHMRLSAQEYWARRCIEVEPAAAAPDPLADLACLCGKSRGLYAGSCCERVA
jgi:hypothetical protein